MALSGESRLKKRWETTEPSECPKGNDSDWRILCINVNNFPAERNGFEKAKFDLLKTTMAASDADIIGMSEVGRNEYNMELENRPTTKIKEWFENGTATATWNHDSITSYEPGGTMIITRDKSTAHTIKRGTDERRLGRWAWISVRGKRDKCTTFISVYRPTNIQATAQNQLNTIRKFNGDIQPEELWEKDLSTLIKEKKKIGEVVVMGDLNDDLNDNQSKMSKFFESQGMWEALNTRYSEGPPTFAFGSRKIDGIYITEGITVSQGGYGGHINPPSDHLYPWIDVKETDIVGAAREDRPPPLLRKATSKIPSVKNEFNRIFNEQIEVHKLAQKVEELLTIAKENKVLLHEQQEMYEKIEERIRRAEKCADSKCRKIRRGKIPFSKKQKELMGKLFVLRAIYVRAKLVGKANRPHWKRIQRLIKKYSYNGQTRFESLKKIKEAICAAAAEYNAFRPKAHEFRLNHRSQLADAIAIETGKDPQVIYKNLTNQEETKRHFKKIRYHEKRGIKTGVDKVDIETEDGIKTVYDKQEIETAIITANKKKLLQAGETPLRQEPLRSLIGERMDFDTWELLLKGLVELPEELEEGTKLWFEAIQNFDEKDIDIDWTAGEYFEAWDKMSEDKSAMPGVQAAHIKSIDRKSDGAEVISSMALIPLITGYAPISWQRGTDSMIPKKKNEWRPDKLRIILLMEARFNHNNKLIGRKMMQHGERSGFLAREQFGSRPAKSAIAHALNKRLTIDIARQSKVPAVYITNDAKACYDRILLMVAYLTMRHMGIPSLAAKSSITTLVEMPRKIKTVYGESELSYGTKLETDEVLHGIGQGNGYGPIIWAGISSPLLKILRSRGYGVHISSPITKEEIKMAGYSYVDDTDQIEMNSETTLWENVLANAQASVDLWECLLRTTGGALEPSKTDWVKVLYEWKNGKPQLQKANEADIITLRDPYGNIVPIQQVQPHTARRTLGVWQAADGQENTQRDILIKKIAEWGSNTNGITNKEATTASISTIGRSIRFPLAATAMTSMQCKEVDKEWKRNVLNKMGIVRTAPNEIAFSPIETGGAGLHFTEIDQTIDHLKMIAAHGNKDTVTGKLLRNTIQQYTIETGLGGEPLNQNVEKVIYLTKNTWIEQTIKSCRKFDITFETDTPQLNTWIDNDKYLMHDAIRVLERQELLNFNNVRLFLQVMTVSDITTADGKQIDIDILRGDRGYSPSPSRNAYEWPRIPEPTKREKEAWTLSLCKMYQITLLRPQLSGTHYGWYTYNTIQYSSWMINVQTAQLYQKWKHLWIEWHVKMQEKDGVTRKILYFKTNNVIDKLEEVKALRPITVRPEQLDVVSVRNKGRFQPREDEEESFDPWYSPSTYPMTVQQENYFIDNIKNSKGNIVTDGSYKEGRSAAATVFQHNKTLKIPKDPTNYISVTVPGPKREQSSYRGELGGILTGIAITNRLLKKHNITGGECTLVCDNKGALAASFGWKTPTPDWTCFDIISLIRNEIKISPITWKGTHVKGHQDDNNTYEELDVNSQANIIADNLAKRELSEWNDDQNYWGMIGQPWGIVCGNQRICGNLEETLRLLMQEEHALKWWKRRLQIPISQYNNVDDEVYKKFRADTAKEIRNWAIKYSSDLLPTRKNLQRRQHSEYHTCPCCGAANENADHIFQCRAHEMKKTYNDGVDDLSAFLYTTTSTAIKNTILQLLQRLRNNTHTAPKQQGLHLEALDAQQKIGLRATLSGFWDKKWIKLQKEYYRDIKSRCSPKTWLTTLSLQIQQLVYSLWKTRNETLHNKENSMGNKAEQDAINKKIKQFFDEVPNLRLLPPCDAAYFGRGMKRIMDYRLTRKKKWIEDAKRILDSFRATLDVSSEAFLDYFTNT